MLDGLENGDLPATKKDIAELRTEIADLREVFAETIHDAETRLLTAFYNWAQGTQRHLWDLDRAEVSLRERLAGVDKRLMDLELGRNPNPPQQPNPPSAP